VIIALPAWWAGGVQPAGFPQGRDLSLQSGIKLGSLLERLVEVIDRAGKIPPIEIDPAPLGVQPCLIGEFRQGRQNDLLGLVVLAGLTPEL